MAPHVATGVGVERIDVDEHSWVDVARGWVAEADALYATLVESVPWRTNRLWRYERWVEEPRVTSWCPRTQPYPHPALAEAQRSLQSRYRVHFEGVALSWYRDGDDSVAFHRDREMRYLEDTVVAVLTLGARRPWLLRRRDRADKWTAPTGGAVLDLAPGPGDLLVLGGRCQADWEHSVPKVPGARGAAAGRISAQWRHTSRRGRPEVGGSYRSPRDFSRRSASR